MDIALFLLVSGGATAATACGSGSEDCASTQTCINTPGEGGEGGGGDDGEGGTSGNGTGGSGRGGSSGSGAGRGGAGTGAGGQGGTGTGAAGAGAAGSGEAGMGGGGTGGGDDGPPTVEAFTPSNGSSNVERDIEVTAELSEAIDEATVTQTSVTLEGPEGEVPGTLSVEDNVIRFVPNHRLYLLGEYTFSLADTIADLDGNTLEASASAEFSVRDGRWSAETLPFGEAEHRHMGEFARNELGDMVLGGPTSETDERPWVSIYDAGANRWTPAQAVRSMASTDLFVYDLAIDDERRAAMTWSGFGLENGGWFRYTPSGGWVDAGAQSGRSRVAISSLGQAVSAWSYMGNLIGQTQDLVAGNVQTAAPIGPTGRGFRQLLASRERVAMVGMTSGTNRSIDVSWFIPGIGWGAPTPIVTGTNLGDMTAESDEAGNLFVMWTQGNEIWSRTYERVTANWAAPLLVKAFETDDLYVGWIDASAGNMVALFGTGEDLWAGYYEAGTGWVPSSIDDIWADLGGYGGLPTVTIDPQGNALTTWGVTDLLSHRYVRGVGWQARVSLEREFYGWAAATSPDGSVSLVGTHLVSVDVSVPGFMRFE